MDVKYTGGRSVGRSVWVLTGCVDVERQPVQEGVGDELREKEREGELQHAGDLQRARERDGASGAAPPQQRRALRRLRPALQPRTLTVQPPPSTLLVVVLVATSSFQPVR